MARRPSVGQPDSREASLDTEEEHELHEIVDASDSAEDSLSNEMPGAENPAGGEAPAENAENDEIARTIFMKDIDYDNREADIRAEMEKIGPVVRVNVPLTYDNRRNKGFAYVEFAKLEDAQRALGLSGTMFLGRKIFVDKATPRSNYKIYTVFCKNLSFETKREELSEYFRKFGPIYNLSLPLDPQHEGRNRGFCFVEYKDEEIAQRVAAERHTVHGRPLITSLGNKNSDRNRVRSSDRLYGRRDNSPQRSYND